MPDGGNRGKTGRDTRTDAGFPFQHGGCDVKEVVLFWKFRHIYTLVVVPWFRNHYLLGIVNSFLCIFGVSCVITKRKEIVRWK